MAAPPLHAPAGYEPPGDEEVWHYHVHVVPRCEGDDLYRSPHRLTTAEERRSYVERLVRALG